MRTKLSAYLHDLMDFVDDRLDDAELNPSTRAEALKSAMGAFPVIRARLRKGNDTLNTQCELLGLFDDDFSQLAGLKDGDYQQKLSEIRARHLAFRKAIQRNPLEYVVLTISKELDPWPDQMVSL